MEVYSKVVGDHARSIFQIRLEKLFKQLNIIMTSLSTCVSILFQ